MNSAAAGGLAEGWQLARDAQDAATERQAGGCQHPQRQTTDGTLHGREEEVGGGGGSDGRRGAVAARCTSCEDSMQGSQLLKGASTHESKDARAGRPAPRGQASHRWRSAGTPWHQRWPFPAPFFPTWPQRNPMKTLGSCRAL